MTPTPVSVKTVNKATARELITAMLSSAGITRGELAAKCNVSAMTAGKVVGAMLDAGYVTVEPEVSKHGRTTEFIYPSERFSFLIFEIGERAMSAEIYDARENTLLGYTEPRNASLDATTDAAAFVSLVNEQLEDIEDTYLLSALLYHQSVNIDMSAPPLGDIAIFKESTDAAALYARNVYPTECIAFVGANGGADISIISDGNAVRGKSASHNQRQPEPSSELEMLDALSLRLSRLFSFLLPDKVIIDSRSLHLSRRFSAELYELLEERTVMKKEELPELVTNDGIPFPSRAVIGQLIDIYAELISGIQSQICTCLR